MINRLRNTLNEFMNPNPSYVNRTKINHTHMPKRNEILKKPILKRHKKSIRNLTGEEEREFEGIDIKGIDQFIETPKERVRRMKHESTLINPKSGFYKVHGLSKKRRHLLFINAGSKKIELLRLAIRTNFPLPEWAKYFQNEFTLSGKQVLFETLPILDDDQKHTIVKEIYFNVQKPATIEHICDHLRPLYANISKRNVRDILKTIETYQLNFRRRRPPTVNGKMSLYKPGTLAMDLFFPPESLGWIGKKPVLAIMDCWSRYCFFYALQRKNKKLIHKCLDDFLQKFLSFGHTCSVILTDKGSEFLGLKSAYGHRFKVLNSPTGMPIQIVEALQAQAMRRATIYRTSYLTASPEDIMHEISLQIQQQKRRNRGNLTPIQLLGLNDMQRKEINDLYQDKNPPIHLKGLKEIFVGNLVRLLIWTRKEQVEGKKKGYSEKWSRDIYKIKSKKHIRKNAEVYRYTLEDKRGSFYRHELLKISNEIDTVVPSKNFTPKIHEILQDEEYIPSD